MLLLVITERQRRNLGDDEMKAHSSRVLERHNEEPVQLERSVVTAIRCAFVHRVL